MLQCVAVCCSVLQCAAVCCSVLQCVDVMARSLETYVICSHAKSGEKRIMCMTKETYVYDKRDLYECRLGSVVMTNVTYK